MALFPSGGAAIKGRVLASFPATVEGSGGIGVSKSNGVWTIEPSWDDLAVETTLADASERELWIYNPDTDVYTRLSVQYLLDNLPAGPAGDDGSLIFQQNSAPATDKPANSIWIDADSTDLDVYQLISSVWTDTGINLKGATGATGASYAATSTSSQAIGNSGTKTFTTQAGLAYQVGTRIRAADASNPTANWMEGVVTSYSSTTLAFTADKSLGSGTLTNWALSVAGQFGADGAGTGDVTAASTFGTDNVVVRSDGTSKGVQASVINIDDTTGTMYPTTNDSGALGKAAQSWSDLFLASGAVINYANGNYTVTHSSGTLTLSGTLSLGTSNAFTCGSIELGNDSDTTISRGAAGVLSVEGVNLYPNLPQVQSQSAAYTAVLGDANGHILHPSSDNNARTFTIPANSSVAYPIGTTLTFINQINTVTIAITTDTMTLASAGSTGSRTLAANGVATAVKIASTSWIINGTGLT